ncbi:thioesterase family protein [Paenibacillus sp. FSL H8-0457]|uniref:acyl-CoA thioesterase n=1 Tax=Paenibacillus TaxID=44249 RepID=UPI0003E1C013|nr:MULTISPECIES: thioesterase family protein [Paenibacillus]ETT68633.1 thioesterase superfamily protein [Paenibacillus sp. FSL H8-457]QOT10701.1 acyl-CoA thioesterase [Paenibacillus sp. JNUCC-32]WFB57181.1 thioesterase family protein [Paenibacillus sp. BR1-192]GIP04911.1 4-hydroxybenzoyl-CoA thioesterase [Paenibacillus lautus]
MASPSVPTRSRWFWTSFRVRYQESDQMGVVYHANYLNWFEIGRTEMIREMGFTYRGMEEEGVLLPVVDLDIKYRRPARYDDLVTIFTRMTAFSPLRIHYEYEVRLLSEQEQADLGARGWHTESELPGALLTAGATRHVWLNREWKPARLDKCAPKLYDALKDTLLGRKE